MRRSAVETADIGRQTTDGLTRRVDNSSTRLFYNVQTYNDEKSIENLAQTATLGSHSGGEARSKKVQGCRGGDDIR